MLPPCCCSDCIMAVTRWTALAVAGRIGAGGTSWPAGAGLRFAGRPGRELLLCEFVVVDWCARDRLDDR